MATAATARASCQRRRTKTVFRRCRARWGARRAKVRRMTSAVSAASQDGPRQGNADTSGVVGCPRPSQTGSQDAMRRSNLQGQSPCTPLARKALLSAKNIRFSAFLPAHRLSWRGYDISTSHRFAGSKHAQIPHSNKRALSTTHGYRSP